MIVRFTASNIVAMILFIPLLIALGLILAFIVPLLAVIAAAAGILFLALYAFAKIGLVKKQRDLFTEKPKSTAVDWAQSHDPFAKAVNRKTKRLGGQSKTTGKIGRKGTQILQSKIGPIRKANWESTVEVKDYKIR